MNATSLLPLITALVCAPFIFGVINRVKAFYGGRRGQPLLQLYYDLAKLLKKGAMYSRTTTVVFRLGPMVGLSCAIIAAAIIPFAGARGLIAFPGDIIFFAYILALMRFFTVIAALDTGSSFEGMGASREVHFSALAEPAFFIGLAVLAKITAGNSLSEMCLSVASPVWKSYNAEIILIAVSFAIVLLTENARIPVDDPNTHLELTMIHEVMVLDHGGPDFAFILYGSALKLWVMGAILVQILIPVHTGRLFVDMGVALSGMLLLGVAIGVVESNMARLRLLRVPQFLVAATALSTLALILTLR